MFLGLLGLVAFPGYGYRCDYWHFTSPSDPGPNIPTTSPFIINGALQLVPNNAVFVPVASTVTIGGDFTFIIRFNLYEYPPSSTEYLFQFTQSDDGVGLGIWNGLLTGLTQNNTNFTLSTTTFTLNEWKVVILIYNNVGYQLLDIDGSAELEQSPLAVRTRDSQTIGGAKLGVNHLNGSIDFLWHRPRALNSDEIAYVYFDVDFWAQSWLFQSESALSSDLTLVGDPVVLDGLHLYGDLSQYVVVNNTVQVGGANASIIVKFMQSVAATTFAPLLEFSGSAGGGSLLFYLTRGGVVVEFKAEACAISPGCDVPPYECVLPTDQLWHDIVITLQGTNMKVFLDGITCASKDFLISNLFPKIARQDQFIGHTNSSTANATTSLVGSIHSVTHLARAMTSSELSFSAMYSPILSTPTQLWQFGVYTFDPYSGDVPFQPLTATSMLSGGPGSFALRFTVQSLPTNDTIILVADDPSTSVRFRVNLNNQTLCAQWTDQFFSWSTCLNAMDWTPLFGKSLLCVATFSGTQLTVTIGQSTHAGSASSTQYTELPVMNGLGWVGDSNVNGSFDYLAYYNQSYTSAAAVSIALDRSSLLCPRDSGTCVDNAVVGTRCTRGCDWPLRPLYPVTMACTVLANSDGAQWLIQDDNNMGSTILLCTGTWSPLFGAAFTFAPNETLLSTQICPLPHIVVDFAVIVFPVKVTNLSNPSLQNGSSLIGDIAILCSDGKWLPAPLSAPAGGILLTAIPDNEGYTPSMLTVGLNTFVSSIGGLGVGAILPVQSLSDFVNETYQGIRDQLWRGFQARVSDDVDGSALDWTDQYSQELVQISFFFAPDSQTSAPSTAPTPIDYITRAPIAFPTTRAPTTRSPTGSPTTGRPTTGSPSTASPTYALPPAPQTSSPTLPPTIAVTIQISNSSHNVSRVPLTPPNPDTVVVILTFASNNSTGVEQLVRQVLTAFYIQLNISESLRPSQVQVTVGDGGTISVSAVVSTQVGLVVQTWISSGSTVLTVDGASLRVSTTVIRWPDLIATLVALTRLQLGLLLTVVALLILITVGLHIKAHDLWNIPPIVGCFVTALSFGLQVWYAAVLHNAGINDEISHPGSSLALYGKLFIVFLILPIIGNISVLLYQWHQVLQKDQEWSLWLKSHRVSYCVGMTIGVVLGPGCLTALSSKAFMQCKILGAPLASNTRHMLASLGVVGSILELPRVVVQIIVAAKYRATDLTATLAPLIMGLIAFGITITIKFYSLGYTQAQKAQPHQHQAGMEVPTLRSY